MRLFVAIDLPEEILGRLERLVEKLKPTARLAWSRVENFHITTKFIGEWPAERLDEMRRTLDALTARAPIPIAVRGLGFFPDRRQARIFWAGIEAPPELAALAEETDAAVGALGVEREKRKFSPHLTLARNRNAAPVGRLLEAIDHLGAPEFGSFTADRLYLYQSELRPGGSVYTRLSEHKFSP